MNNYLSNCKELQFFWTICSKAIYILKNNVKPVIRIIENQEIEYPSISEAARQLKVTDGAIRYALKNNSKCCQSYWKYK